MVKLFQNVFRRKVTYLTLAMVCVVVMASSFACFAHSSELKMYYSESNALLPGNPNIGYAPRAGKEELEPDITLVYMGLTWRELEPREGEFDWSGIETEYNLARWREEGKHVVLRFILDYPRDESHMDIPDWLYEKIGGDGNLYDNSYGRGFSPNYSNQILIQYHKRAIEAMGARWGQDGFISYIQLGSLGHWGEWHIKAEDDMYIMPKADVREQYILPYITSFPHARILMRRPFRAASTYNFGVFNDMVGEKESTDEWLGWLKNGGHYMQAEERNELVAILNWWEKAPVGGEFTSDLSMRRLLINNLNQTLDMIKESHMTFIGPKYAEVFGNDRNGYDRVRKQLGYRIWISKAEIDFADRTKITLTWNNTGAAPMYHKWNSYLYLEEPGGGNIATIAIPMDMTTLMPGMQQSVTFHAPIAIDPSVQNIFVGTVDPMTGKDAVHYAVKGQENETRLRLFYQKGR